MTAGLDPDAVAATARMAVSEDLMGGVDVTSTATITLDQRSVATFGARAAGVVAGLPIAAAVIEAVCGDSASKFVHLVSDGDRIDAGTEVARVTAPTRLLLTAERSALNLLCHLSGIATLTRRWADELAGTAARVRDTRKTTPGLRALEKYAVRCGGGVNHRMGLSDMALVKDNHVAAAGGVAAAYALVRALEATIPVEIEVDTLDGLRDAIDAGADEVLLDNFDLETTHAAVAYRDAARARVRLEASGGLTVEVARRVAETGVDFIAVGELDPLGAGARPGSRPARPVRRLSARAAPALRGSDAVPKAPVLRDDRAEGGASPVQIDREVDARTGFIRWWPAFAVLLAIGLGIAVIAHPGPLPGELGYVRWLQGLDEPVPTLADFVWLTTGTEAALVVAALPACWLLAQTPTTRRARCRHRGSDDARRPAAREGTRRPAAPVGPVGHCAGGDREHELSVRSLDEHDNRVGRCCRRGVGVPPTRRRRRRRATDRVHVRREWSAGCPLADGRDRRHVARRDGCVADGVAPGMAAGDGVIARCLGLTESR